MGSKKCHLYTLLRFYLLVTVLITCYGKYIQAGDYESRRFETDNSGSTGKTFGSFGGLESKDRKTKTDLGTFSSYGSGTEDFVKREDLFETASNGGGTKQKDKPSLDVYSKDDSSSSLISSDNYKSGFLGKKISDNTQKGGLYASKSSDYGNVDVFDYGSGLTHKDLGNVGDLGSLGYSNGDSGAKFSGNYGNGAKNTMSEGIYGAKQYKKEESGLEMEGSVSISKGSSYLSSGKGGDSFGSGAKYLGSEGGNSDSGSKGLGKSNGGSSGYNSGSYNDFDSSNQGGEDFSGTKGSNKEYGGIKGYINGDSGIDGETGLLGHKQISDYIDKTFDLDGKSFNLDSGSASDSGFYGNKNAEFISVDKQSGGSYEEDVGAVKGSGYGEDSVLSNKDTSGGDGFYDGKGSNSKSNGYNNKNFDTSKSIGKEVSGEDESASKFSGDYDSDKSEYGGSKMDFSSGKTGYVSSKIDYGSGKTDYGSGKTESSNGKTGYSSGQSDYGSGKTDSGSGKTDYSNVKANYGSSKTESKAKSDSGSSNYGSGKTDLYNTKLFGGIKGGYSSKVLSGSSKQYSGPSDSKPSSSFVDSSSKDYEDVFSQVQSGKEKGSADLYGGGEKGFKLASDYESSGTNGNSVVESEDNFEAVEPIDDNTVCKSGEEFASHPTYCNKFYQCANGKPFLIVCPMGLVFNIKYHICDWPSNVDCASDSDIAVLHLPSSRHPRHMLTPSKAKASEAPKPISSPLEAPKISKSEPMKLLPMTEYVSEDSSNSYSDSKEEEKISDHEESDSSPDYISSHDYKDDYDTKGNDWGKTSYSAPAQGSSGVICSSGEKYVRHPSDCTKFYQCAHSKPFLMSCPASLYFNTELDVCDWPSNVDCSGSSSSRQSSESDYDSNYSDSYPPYSPPYHKTSKSSSSYTPTVYSSPSDTKGDESSFYQPPSSSHQSGGYDSGSYDSSARGYGSMPSGQSMPGFIPMSPFHYPIMPVFHPPIFQPIIPYYPKQPSYQTSKSNSKGEDGSNEAEEEEESKSDGSESKDDKEESGKSYDHKQPSEGSDDKFYQESYQKTDTQDNSKKTSFRPANTNNNKGFYHYDYDSSSNRGGNKGGSSRKGDTGSSDNKGIYYYYYDSANKNSNNNGKQDYAYYYDYDPMMFGGGGSSNNYDYFTYDFGGKGYDYSSLGGSRSKGKQLKSGSQSQSQYYGGSKNKNYQPNLQKMTDGSDEVEYIHFDHTGSGSSKGSQSQGSMQGSDLSSLLPLILLGSTQGQQLILTTAVLSKLKNVANSMGGKGESLMDTKGLFGGGSKGGSGDLIKTLFLLRLLNGNTATATTGTTTNTVTNAPLSTAANVRFTGTNFVTIAGNAPVVFIDPATGQQVPDTQVAIDPITGSVFDATTNRVLMYLDPTTGTLTQAFAAPPTTVPLVRSLNTVPNTFPNVLTRALSRNPLSNLLGGATNANSNNRVVSFVPAPTAAPPTGAVTGRDAINLIFLSPLTPSSLPPPILGNDGSATAIRGSLRDILGDDLTRFLNSAQLVPGQSLPNSPAGSQRSCTVIRSGETVPYRVSPRAGRRLNTEECQAMGQLLDKFIPTFLQNFVPSDAAFAGFGSNQRNNNGGALPPLQPSTGGSALEGSNINDLFGGGFGPISPTPARTDSPTVATSLNQFITIRNDRDGCTIAVPNIVPQC